MATIVIFLSFFFVYSRFCELREKKAKLLQFICKIVGFFSVHFHLMVSF